MLEVTGDANPVRAGLYRKGKKFNLSHPLVTCITFTSDILHCCSATCVLAIWSVISILNSALGMLLEMLSDAPAFTVGILLHTHRLDLSHHRFIGTTAVTYLSSSEAGPPSLACDMLSLSYIWTDQSCGLLFFFENASVPILGGLPGSVQQECFLSWGQNGNDKAIAILSALPW